LVLTYLSLMLQLETITKIGGNRCYYSNYEKIHPS